MIIHRQPNSPAMTKALLMNCTVNPVMRFSQSACAVMSGQVGVEKKPFVERVAEIARQRGHKVAVCHVGEMMYAEAPDVVKGRILDLPRSRLDLLRRSVFKDILRIKVIEVASP